MRYPFVATILSLATLLAACGTSAGSPTPPEPDPTEVKPAATAVLALDDGFQFRFMPGEAVTDVEWDVELEYDTRDVEAVFDYYDDALAGQGFTRTDIDRGDDDIEADYENGDGLTIELEVELDDGRVDVDFDVDDFVGPFPAGFSLTEFAGLELPIYPDADVVDVEWDFNFDHPGTDTEAVFDYYDQHLQDLGWTQTELDDGDDDEWEAEYVNEGVHLELEVEDDSEVEIEVNKLRFY